MTKGQKYHVYMLIDPRKLDGDGKDVLQAVFYVGKGTGARSEAHEFESAGEGENKKVERIEAIEADGLKYKVAYATYDGETELTEDEAYRLEAALIWALRPQLTNKVAGHGFGPVYSESLEAIANAQRVDAPDDVSMMLVWANGIRGGVDPSGSFVAADDADVWENVRRWWIFGKGKLNDLDKALENGEPVALLGLTKGKRGVENIVDGVFQISGWHYDHDSDGKVVFERVEPGSAEEHARISRLRDELVGNELAKDGYPLIDPRRWGSNASFMAEGKIRMPKVIGPAFS